MENSVSLTTEESILLECEIDNSRSVELTLRCIVEFAFGKLLTSFTHIAYFGFGFGLRALVRMIRSNTIKNKNELSVNSCIRSTYRTLKKNK